jgi:hypothetical protein
MQVSPHSSISHEDQTANFSWCLLNLSRSSALLLHGLPMKSLPCLWPGKSLQALGWLVTPWWPIQLGKHVSSHTQTRSRNTGVLHLARREVLHNCRNEKQWATRNHQPHLSGTQLFAVSHTYFTITLSVTVFVTVTHILLKRSCWCQLHYFEETNTQPLFGLVISSNILRLCQYLFANFQALLKWQSTMYS